MTDLYWSRAMANPKYRMLAFKAFSGRAMPTVRPSKPPFNSLIGNIPRVAWPGLTASERGESGHRPVTLLSCHDAQLV